MTTWTSTSSSTAIYIIGTPMRTPTSSSYITYIDGATLWILTLIRIGSSPNIEEPRHDTMYAGGPYCIDCILIYLAYPEAVITTCGPRQDAIREPYTRRAPTQGCSECGGDHRHHLRFHRLSRQLRSEGGGPFLPTRMLENAGGTTKDAGDNHFDPKQSNNHANDEIITLIVGGRIRGDFTEDIFLDISPPTDNIICDNLLLHAIADAAVVAHTRARGFPRLSLIHI